MTKYEPFSIDGVVNSYIDWLEVKAPDHRLPFVQRLRHDPAGAHAEAVTFSVLRAKHKNPEPAETVGTGGVDFMCRPYKQAAFVVEVTALNTASVTRKSRLAGPLKGNRVGSFSRITTSLMHEAVNKASQMSNYPVPRVLVLAASHPDASMLLGAGPAEELLTGTTVISMRLGDVAAEPQQVAKLQNSVFMRLTSDGQVEAARQSISAILLMSISANAANVIGLLHPAPAHPFDPGTFETIHFVRLRHWPITDRFEIEWIGPKPSPTPVPHWPVSIDDRDLR